MAMARVSAAAGVVFTFASVANQAADGHIMQTAPVSRQYSRGPAFKEMDDPTLEHYRDRFNAKGPKHVKARAKRETDPNVLAAYGGGDEFPLYYGKFADNGNYLETNEIAVRHDVCGDLEQDAVFNTPNINWEPLDSIESGKVLEMDVVVSDNKKGHVEFFLCNADEMDDPDGVPTQECFNQHPLTRSPDDSNASPIDPNYTGRYYLDPECRAEETARETVKMRYLLPDMECEHCILQMVYYTGHTCKHVGYDEFDPESWPSTCAPSKSDWIELNRHVCGTNGAYPEEFRACSDLSLRRAATPTSVQRQLHSFSDYASEAGSSASFDDDWSDDGGVDVMTCSNGVKGIESKGACCVYECGQCGGAGCSTVGLSLGLGAADCCDSSVLEAGEPCGEAPCVLGDPDTTVPEECPGEPVAVYDQCGGSTWTGSTCCEDGLECVVMGKGDCYAQCRPIPETAATPSPSKSMPEYPATPAPVPPPTEAPATLATPAPATPGPVGPEPTPTPDTTTEGDSSGGKEGCLVVKIEAETLDVYGSWKKVNADDASGGAYITWEGLEPEENNRSAEDGDIISTMIEIPAAGTYSFKWLMRQSPGVESDRANDSWLYFPDAARFGPAGTGDEYGGFIKVFGNSFDVFKYSGRADVDHVKSEVAIEFDSAGSYEMQIAGRSHGHQIDQIMLYSDTISLDDASEGCK